MSIYSRVWARNALRAYIDGAVTQAGIRTGALWVCAQRVHRREWVPVPDQNTVQMIWHDDIRIETDVWPESWSSQPLFLDNPTPTSEVKPAALYLSKNLKAAPRTQGDEIDTWG